MKRLCRPTALALAALALVSSGARAQESAPVDSTATSETRLLDARPGADGLEHLVPELAGNTYRLEPGVRPYLHRLSVSPAFGSLGSERLFALRVAYSPNRWLAYEGSLGHNPSQAVHAVLHQVSAIVRHPFPGRLQPYASGGYGMMVVLPGKSLNADPVTKNALSVGGGLELFIRGDLALRGEMRRTTVLGRQQNREGIVAFNYAEMTVGLAFYRTLKP